MGLLDKVKAQAEQAMAKAQQGMGSGQARTDQQSEDRQADLLLRNLGAAVYAERYQEGANQAVLDAFAAVEAFTEQHGSINVTSNMGAPPGLAASGPMGSPNAAPFAGPATQPGPIAGDFTLDDG